MKNVLLALLTAAPLASVFLTTSPATEQDAITLERIGAVRMAHPEERRIRDEHVMTSHSRPDGPRATQEHAKR
jgi:hypothetical protein